MVGSSIWLSSLGGGHPKVAGSCCLKFGDSHARPGTKSGSTRTGDHERQDAKVTLWGPALPRGATTHLLVLVNACSGPSAGPMGPEAARGTCQAGKFPLEADWQWLRCWLNTGFASAGMGRAVALPVASANAGCVRCTLVVEHGMSMERVARTCLLGKERVGFRPVTSLRTGEWLLLLITGFRAAVRAVDAEPGLREPLLLLLSNFRLFGEACQLAETELASSSAHSRRDCDVPTPFVLRLL